MEVVLPAIPAVAEPAAASAATAARERDRADQLELVHRCQRREAGAFEELVRGFQTRVFSVVRGVLRNSNDVEDVAQQVFTKIYFALPNFNNQSSVATWIYKIAVNECYDHLRKQRVRKVSVLADLSPEESARVENFPASGSGSGLENQVAGRELAAKLLARVNPEDRVLLVLKEIEGYSVRELAEILSLNENTVKVRLFRARQALTAALERKLV